jgi:hypothetical protein
MWFLGIFGRVYEEIGVPACRKRRSPCEVLDDQVVLHDGSKYTDVPDFSHRFAIQYSDMMYPMTRGYF